MKYVLVTFRVGYPDDATDEQQLESQLKMLTLIKGAQALRFTQDLAIDPRIEVELNHANPE